MRSGFVFAEGSSSGTDVGELAHLRRTVDEQRVTSHFQPIVDLCGGTTLGYEVLSRPWPPFDSIEQLFWLAKQFGMTWELERVCRIAALSTIAKLTPELRNQRYFINVSPDILTDPRFIHGFTRSQIGEYGLDQGNIVIEITERDSVNDHRQFEALIRHYERQGFKIALDDFGSGHSSLVTLVSSSPHFLKLDKQLVREIHLHSYKQRLVRSLVSFASSVDTKLIAEGVEQWEELDILSHLGVRYAQGYLLARPKPDPPAMNDGMPARVKGLTAAFDCRRSELDETVGHMVIRGPTVEAGRMRCADLDVLYRHHPETDDIVVTDGSRPVGLLTRQHFYDKTSGPVGYSLFSRKLVEEVAKTSLLLVVESTHITTLAKLAMDRMRADLYDPVIVTDGEGGFVGTVTMKQLITRSTELDVQNAAGASPLTGLPGNRTITKWLQDAMDAGRFGVVYADLDHFKEYNDVYGFLAGDELIRLAARVLGEGTRLIGEAARLGHVGGDDFVIVAPEAPNGEALQRICQEFDRLKLEFFGREHIQSGVFSAVDRQGQESVLPLTTLSLAAIDGALLAPDAHPAILSQLAASLKKRAKRKSLESGQSSFAFERRRHASSRPPP
jgi:diguanylate cyclase (GGDEF)-like protein